MQKEFNQDFPAEVEFFKIKELGIEKILIVGTREEITATTDMLVMGDGPQLYPLEDAYLLGYDDVVWGDDNAEFGETRIEIYKLWLLRKI